RDPILFAGGSSNLFEYVVDDPVDFIDENGEQFISLGIATELGFEPLLSEDTVAPEPVEPPDPLKMPIDQYHDAFQKYYKSLRPGVQQPESLPPPVPTEPWWMKLLRLLPYAENWPWGSSGIPLWLNPCPNLGSPQKNKEQPSPPPIDCSGPFGQQLCI
ncbi:MAG: hypothetical protein ACRD22_17315, partial [Terriglobia bacterium]